MISRAFRCAACGAIYPTVDDIPLVFEDAVAALDDFRKAAHAFVAGAARNAHAIERERARMRDHSMSGHSGAGHSGAGSEGTKERLDALARGVAESTRAISALLEDAGLEPLEGPSPVNLMDCMVQTLRDWAWQPDDENKAMLALIDERELGEMLVLGAGACRLAYDLHERATKTVALDINPLPFFVARRMLAGHTIELWEFPATPKRGAPPCVRQTLRAPGPLGEGFALVFADALSLPVRAGAFDTVLTPWFIDQVPVDIAEMLPLIAYALRPGGRWINVGPLIYRQTIALGHRYGLDEVVAMASQAGLALDGEPRAETMRYLCSPASSQGRLEEVFSFTARRDEALRQKPEPPWKRRGDVPVPRFAGLSDYVAPNPVFAAVAAMIDGRTSAHQIAAQLVRKHGIAEAGASDGVRVTIRKIYDAL